VKIDKEEEQTKSGILLPSSAQKKPTQGQIVVAGDKGALKASTWTTELSKEGDLSKVNCGLDNWVPGKRIWPSFAKEGEGAIGVCNNQHFGLLCNALQYCIPPSQFFTAHCFRVKLQGSKMTKYQTLGDPIFEGTPQDVPTCINHLVSRQRTQHIPLISLLAVQSGDKVVYSKFAGTEVSLEGQEHVLLKVTCPPPSPSHVPQVMYPSACHCVPVKTHCDGRLINMVGRGRLGMGGGGAIGLKVIIL